MLINNCHGVTGGSLRTRKVPLGTADFIAPDFNPGLGIEFFLQSAVGTADFLIIDRGVKSVVPTGLFGLTLAYPGLKTLGYKIGRP